MKADEPRLYAGRLRPRRVRIMVVDDDAMVRALVKLHLVNHGYDVLEAEDAIVAGHLVLRTPPDLVICDVDMPYMDGYQFVSALKSDTATREIPVVFLTVVDDVADRAKSLGAVAYLNKPVTADRLLDVVAYHVPSDEGRAGRC